MKTAMQELKEDLFDTLTTSKEALEEIEDKEKAKDIYRYLEATLKLIIQEIENDYMLKEKEQIETAFNDGASWELYGSNITKEQRAEKYYNEIFNI